jgi:hypothetical protein
LASSSLALCNETRNAGLDDFVEPLSGRNAIDFVKRVFRKIGDIKISRARAAVLVVVSTAVPRWTAHASRTCAGVFPACAAIAEMTGSSSNPVLIP